MKTPDHEIKLRDRIRDIVTDSETGLIDFIKGQILATSLFYTKIPQTLGKEEHHASVGRCIVYPIFGEERGRRGGSSSMGRHSNRWNMLRRILRSPALYLTLGIYLGGHLRLLKPLVDTLEELEATSRNIAKEMEHRVDQFSEKLQNCHRDAPVASSTLASVWKKSFSEKREADQQASNPVCQKFDGSPFGPPSANSLWLMFRDRIHASSRLTKDSTFTQSKMIDELINLVSPRLVNSVKSVVRDWTRVDEILMKAMERYQFLEAENNDNELPTSLDAPPPVRILVMGGSVTRGTNCAISIPGVTRFDCAWPSRLEQLLNRLFFNDKNIVEVKVVGIGGSNSATGTVILKDELLRKDARNPDILIHSYATNDMHVLTMEQAKNSNITLHSRVFGMSQAFVRETLKADPCTKEPLLLWMDDYLGNEQRDILAISELSQGIHVLANYYGFTFLSYADMVRDWVYGDTRETLFSPSGWYQKGVFAREVHPGAGAHLTMAYVVAFNLLNLITTYCALETNVLPLPLQAVNKQISAARRFDKKEEFGLIGKPAPLPKGIPPQLSRGLSLEHISDLWHESSHELRAPNPDSPPPDCRDKCIFSWVSGMDMEQNDPVWVNKLFAPFILKSTDWKLAEGHKKIGYIPIGPIGSTLSLEFKDVGQPIQSVSLFTMKSYGPKWKDSEVRVTISARSEQSREWDTVGIRDLVGAHEKKTSEMYMEIFSFAEVQKHGSVRIDMALSSGTTFKLLGLTICS